MSKKKNTLKDLDEFLKQQATTFVSPPTIQDKLESTPITEDRTGSTADQFTLDDIADQLKKLSSSDPLFRKKFYDLIIQSLENLQASLPEDKMLINTALYLKSGSQWKEVIREYWKTKSLS